MNKTVSFAAALVVVLLIASFVIYNDRQNQEQRLALYASQLEKLMTQVDERSLNRVDWEQQIQSLERELAASKDQLLALSNELTAERQKARPEYERMERGVRARILAEMSGQQPTVADDRVQLFRSLNALSPEEMGSIMMLQSQFGDFLNSLNVSDERMGVIVAALDQLIREQNETRQQEMEKRMSAIREAVASGEPPTPETLSVSLADSLSSLFDIEGQLEALSYDLNDEELDAFRRHQEAQAANARAGLRLGGGPGGAFIGGTSAIRSVMVNDGDGVTETTEIIGGPGFFSSNEPIMIEMDTRVIEPD